MSREIINRIEKNANALLGLTDKIQDEAQDMQNAHAKIAREYQDAIREQRSMILELRTQRDEALELNRQMALKTQELLKHVNDLQRNAQDAKTDEVDLLDTIETRRVELYNGLGFVELLDMMPRRVPRGRTADISVSRSARVSYMGSDKSHEEDANLVRYLMEHRHTSPSESVQFTFRIRCPIFVERQLVRHRTASLNEQSFRYTVPTDSFYYPDLRAQSVDNRQGSSDAALGDEARALWLEVQRDTAEMYKKYERLVALGAAREVARCCLPVAIMTELVWTIDLHNLLHFLGLRMDKHAQLEIRVLADAICRIVTQVAPVSMDAFRRFRLDAVSFNADELAWSREIFASENREQALQSVAERVKSVRRFRAYREKLNALCRA